jgi:hypothetical protein
MSILSGIPQWLFIGLGCVVPFLLWLFIGRAGDFNDRMDESLSPWLHDWAIQDRESWNRAAFRGFILYMLIALFLPFLVLLI